LNKNLVAHFEIFQLAGLAVVDVFRFGLDPERLVVAKHGLVEHQLVLGDLLDNSIDVILQVLSGGCGIAKARGLGWLVLWNARKADSTQTAENRRHKTEFCFHRDTLFRHSVSIAEFLLPSAALQPIRS